MTPGPGHPPRPREPGSEHRQARGSDGSCGRQWTPDRGVARLPILRPDDGGRTPMKMIIAIVQDEDTDTLT
ncbi:MAG: protein from nitrogen regulatory protein P-II (GLNB) family, ortholog YAAQ B. subtilis, partial [uncultured Thermomicrobiales bacterium]